MAINVRSGLFAAMTAILAITSGVSGNSASPTLAVFDNDTTTPGFASWNGSAWSGSTMPAMEATHFIVLRDCPTRNEIACAIHGHDKKVYVTFCKNSSWTTPVVACTDVEISSPRNVDVAYEHSSGDALIAYWSNTANKIGYRTYDGTTFSTESTLTLPASTKTRYVVLDSNPTNNEIALTILNDGKDVYGAVWSGTGWSSVTTLETDTGTTTARCVDMEYEGLSGKGMVVYAENGQNTPRYRTLTGSTWSAEGSLPSVGDTPLWITLSSSTINNGILFGSLDGNKDINVNVWTGSAWGTNLEVEADAVRSDGRCFDMTYETDSARGLLVYGENGATPIRYRTWSGTAWSSEGVGPDLGADVERLRLDQGAMGGEVFVAAGDADSDFEIARWDGSTFSTFSKLAETRHGGVNYEGYAICAPQGAAPTSTDVSVTKVFDVQSSDDVAYASGFLWGDLDNDGDLDCVVTGNNSSRILKNNNAGASFTNTLLGGGVHSRQAALLDFDNDNDLDIWIREKKLYLNNGAGVFSDSGNLGFNGSDDNDGVAAGDIDHDGWCDLVMCSPNGNWIAHNQGPTSVTLVGTKSTTYGMNDSGDSGNGNFMSAGDINNDGWLDIFYHYNGGKLFRSDGDGTYTENVGAIATSNGDGDKVGSCWGDFDNDGDLDLFVPRKQKNQQGSLWQNSNGTFANVATAKGVTDASGQISACWGDYDNDGDLDLYIGNNDNKANAFYENQGAPNYTFIYKLIGASAPGKTHDCVFVDFDNDGDLDIALAQEGKGNVLFRNSTDGTNYLKVRLLGLGNNRTNMAAIGVRVDLWNAAGTTFLARRDVGIARGRGIEPMWVHFGGVTNSTTYMLKVYFNSRSFAAPQTVKVSPASVSTTIGSVTIPQMATVEEKGPVKIIQWHEVRNQGTP